MKKIELRMNEKHKYEVIKKLVDTNGNKKDAAAKLNCSVRTVNRLIILYKNEGKEGFVHKNRGKTPSTAIPLDIKERIVSNYIDNYKNVSFKHYIGIVKKDFDISITDTTLSKWMRERFVISPNAKKKTKRDLKKIKKI